MDKDKAVFGWNFDNTYTRLPQPFFVRVNPDPVEAPKIAILNRELAQSLGLNSEALASAAGAGFFSGNVIPPGAEPIAQAYAGHQFGRFTMLGDGRANLLGEQVTPSGMRFDIQLKGSGPTPFSRGGDGRAALGPMLREYIISEAMYGLGIPTTRSLAVVRTGENVFRETPLPGAVLARVSSSHLRVGTFEYAAALDQSESLRALADYTIRRHYPEIMSEPEPYLGLLLAVLDKQAALVARWMLVGFVHGVMNTDNVSLAGETIDYGPCAFMDQYSRTTVFSSIDRGGRYAYGNQPQIAQWNITRFAETLLPLFAASEDEAVAKAEQAIESFSGRFESYWLQGLRAKLGLLTEEADDAKLVQSLLLWMEERKADYTATFRALSYDSLPKLSLFEDSVFKEWFGRWEARNPSRTLMLSHNPAIVPRNYRVEEALDAAVERDDYSVMERLLTLLKEPYREASEAQDFLAPPPEGRGTYQTFCGT